MGQSGIILIVDDDPNGHEILKALLSIHDYQLAFASDGQEALEKAALLAPDLVLLDVMMPGMNGYEVCEKLRSDPHLSEVPVIMLTALNDPESRIQGFQAGADDFISKPFDRTELLARVQTTTRLNRYRRLLAERARFEWVAEHAETGFLLVNQDDVVIYANRQARLYLNMSSNCFDKLNNPEDPINEPFLTLVQQYYQCKPMEAWTTWPDPPPPETMRYLVRPETSSSHALWLQVERTDLPERLHTGQLIRLSDVTEQMNRKRQTWSFHSLIVHKLNTPLTGLINSLSFLSEDVEDMSHTEIRELSELALKNAYRLHEQVKDIWSYMRMPDIAQPGSGCNLSDIPHIVRQHSTDMGLQSVTLSGFEHMQEHNVVLSHQAVELIFREIFENAIKFHPSHTPTIEIYFSSHHENEITMQFYDDGISLSPEHITRAWIPYYQAEKEHSGEVPGMGLGLAMVATLLWNVGGRYSIINRTPGPGVIVELVIPIASQYIPDEC